MIDQYSLEVKLVMDKIAELVSSGTIFEVEQDAGHKMEFRMPDYRGPIVRDEDGDIMEFDLYGAAIFRRGMNHIGYVDVFENRNPHEGVWCYTTGTVPLSDPNFFDKIVEIVKELKDPMDGYVVKPGDGVYHGS